MSRYKVLKSVAHNIGHSFTSLMNYADDDYAMGHILRFARSSGCDTLMIDFATGKGGPPELLRDPISNLPARYTKFFWDLVQRHGSERRLIEAVTLTLRYDLSVNYKAEFRSWWYPERQKIPGLKKSPWWKFWAR